MSQATVLVIDDEEGYVDVLREILASYGLNVSIAHSAADAMRAIEADCPRLMIVDVMMPEIDGLSLIRWIRSRPGSAETPIVVASARVMPDEQAAALEAGADAFLPKPFTTHELRAAIRPYVSIPQTGELTT